MLFFLKWLFLGIIFLFLSIILLAVVLLKWHPAFGAKPTADQKNTYRHSPNYEDGKFVNLQAQHTVYKGPDFVDNSIEAPMHRKPASELPIRTISNRQLNASEKDTMLYWIGHSTVLLKMQGLTIWIDPMFSAVPSPIGFVGRPRYSSQLPFDIKGIDTIDAVLLTHDHYDHLDYASIKKIKDRATAFYCPLGMRAHLQRWGVKQEKIIELDWHQKVNLRGLELVLTPSHHYSGRSLNDRFESLWGGWVIACKQEKLYISGDGGYGPHFKAIGQQYGPFDLALIECGQYCKYWLHNHLFPEQTAQVALDVGAKRVMPIHWGAFTLAFHAWNAPVERLISKAATLNIEVCTPEIGAAVNISKQDFPTTRWWTEPV